MSKKSDEPRSATQMVGLQLRFQERIRGELESTAKANGNSLNSEVVARLERTLAEDERAGGYHNRRLFDRLAIAIEAVERQSGHRWNDDPATFAAAKRALLDEITSMAPPMADEPEVIAKGKRLMEAQAALVVLLKSKIESNEAALAGVPPDSGLARAFGLVDGKSLDAAIADCRHDLECAEAQLETALGPQREAERRGREIHREWRKAKRAEVDRAIRSKAYGS